MMDSILWTNSTFIWNQTFHMSTIRYVVIIYFIAIWHRQRICHHHSLKTFPILRIFVHFHHQHNSNEVERTTHNAQYTQQSKLIKIRFFRRHKHFIVCTSSNRNFCVADTSYIINSTSIFGDIAAYYFPHQALDNVNEPKSHRGNRKKYWFELIIKSIHTVLTHADPDHRLPKHLLCLLFVHFLGFLFHFYSLSKTSGGFNCDRPQQRIVELKWAQHVRKKRCRFACSGVVSTPTMWGSLNIKRHEALEKKTKICWIRRILSSITIALYISVSAVLTAHPCEHFLRHEKTREKKVEREERNWRKKPISEAVYHFQFFLSLILAIFRLFCRLPLLFPPRTISWLFLPFSFRALTNGGLLKL